MTKFYTGIRSVEVYLKEIERYYNLLKNSKDIDQYGHYLILMKKQIGISEKAVKDNSLVEGIKNYHPNYIPPGLRPEYRSRGKL